MAALVDANVMPVKVWACTQSPNETRQYVAEALGLEKTDVECQVSLLGGGFGRKSKPDYAYEAAVVGIVDDANVPDAPASWGFGQNAQDDNNPGGA